MEVTDLETSHSGRAYEQGVRNQHVIQQVDGAVITCWDECVFVHTSQKKKNAPPRAQEPLCCRFYS